MKNIIRIIGIVALILSFANLYAQDTEPDTVEVEFGEKSKAIFHIANSKDMKTLKELDFDDIIENIDTSLKEAKEDSTEEDEETGFEITIGRGIGFKSNKDKKKKNTVSHNIDINLGLNMFLQDGKTVSGTNYDLRPIGSRYISLGSMFKTRLSNGKLPIYFKYGVEFSWYNFMFEGNNYITKGQDENLFLEHDLTLKKSKLTTSFISLPVMFIIGNKHKNMFTLGLGGYVGYRLGSHSKLIYSVDGKKQTDKAKSNFYLNDIRYGVKMELGIGGKHDGVTLFANYDMNELFQSGKGPALQVFSFGVKL